MSETKSENKPQLRTLPSFFPKLDLDYPITPKENMKMVFDRKKPMWVPNMNTEKALVLCPHDNDRPFFTDSGKDWFGVDWTFVPVAGGQMVTPNTFILNDLLEWEEKFIFPDLDSMDFTPLREEAAANIDPDIVNFYLMQDGLFERLLSLCTAEEVFCFLAEEEESAIKFFNAMADYKIKLMDKVIKEWAPFDVFINSDDWGTQISTFISPEMYAKYIFEPMKRIVDFAHQKGKYMNFHSCGKIETLIPQIVKLNPDMWEAQPMNDLFRLRKEYGRQLPIQIGMDAEVINKPGITDEELKAYVHEYVDKYAGNGGLLATYMTRDPHTHEVIAKELLEYSLNYYNSRS
ncbi:uroporphyrinogen decarboxylase (URO-D) [Oxobacter pfennigii]|uniref:Uroporphyrinogen decarboxylase (URO-D) n=1 Tax=Oxobacter pfennigii TaxID=36849 RepID=A0A0P9AG82_9CLOT|nr:uroporphyrinogen decarboxylase family protein [Oxobacter pfennigii]KPU44412.1 uroporphyrinogen decarboxylase (URO-D) [Oxobacter pfennigii]